MSSKSASLLGAAAIVGIAEAASPTGELDLWGGALEARVIADALEDSALSLADVDGVEHPWSSLDLAEFLGIAPTFSESTYVGGAGFEMYVEKAATAIAAGVAETIVIVYAATPRGDRRRGGGVWEEAAGPRGEFEVPYGLGQSRPGGISAHVVVRDDPGTPCRRRCEHPPTGESDSASEVPGASDRGGGAPLARHLLTVAPAGLLLGDRRGRAVVMTSAHRARDLRQALVYVLGASSYHTHNMISAMPDLTVTPGAISGPRAMQNAGTRERRLLLQFCEPCQSFVHHPREACPTRLDTDLSWRESEGSGAVHAFSVHHRPFGTRCVEHCRYVVTFVDLDEGVRFLANVIDVDHSALRVADRVTLTWTPGADGLHLPAFEPARR